MTLVQYGDVSARQGHRAARARPRDDLRARGFRRWVAAVHDDPVRATGRRQRERQRHRPARRSVENRRLAAHKVGEHRRAPVLGGEPHHRDVILRVVPVTGGGIVRGDQPRDVP